MPDRNLNDPRRSPAASGGVAPAMALALLLAACADTTPATIRFAAPPDPVVNGNLFSLDAALVNAGGETLARATVGYSSSAPEVAEVSTSGGLRCLRTGDATIVLAGGGMSRPVSVRCRIPTEISMPSDLRLLLGAKPLELRARALGEGGVELKDVPVAVVSSDYGVVMFEGGRVKPVAVGRAILRASVGAIQAVTPVTVAERIVSEPLALADGARRSWRLDPGTYQVAIDVKADVRARQGVTLSWDGARCENLPESESHRASCAAPEGATLTVANPEGIGLGARVTGTVSIERVPAD